MLSRRAGLSAIAGLSCYSTFLNVFFILSTFFTFFNVFIFSRTFFTSMLQRTVDAGCIQFGAREKNVHIELVCL